MGRLPAVFVSATNSSVSGRLVSKFQISLARISNQVPGITRKQFLATAAGGLMSFSQVAKRPPNVLLLMSDQHKPHCLGIDGHPVARTPNLDALARSGVRFDRAYCSNPVCVPSRASLLTGLYTHYHRAYSNTVPWPYEVQTMAHYFHRAGYMTGLIGKMHFVDAQTHGF